MRRFSNRALLERVLGQCDADNPNIRATAFEKAREILARDGLRFSDLIVDQPGREAPPPPPTPTPPPQRTARQTPPRSGPYIHERVAGRLARRHRGKRIIRGKMPPPGTIGRLRILGDETVLGVRTLTLSLETEAEIYEPYQTVLFAWGKETAQQYETLVGASRSGRLIQY